MNDNKPSLSLLALFALGPLTVTLSACSETTFSGATWNLQTWTSGESAIQPLHGTTPSITFQDGSVSGSTGCNQYFGTYAEMQANRIDIDIAGSSRKACAGPIMAQERKYLDALAGTHTYRVRDNGHLEIQYSGNGAAGSLVFEKQ